MAYGDLVLYDQEMSLYPAYSDKTVSHMLSEESKKIGKSLVVDSLLRWERGEGIERKEEDFAEEVRKQAQG